MSIVQLRKDRVNAVSGAGIDVEYWIQDGKKVLYPSCSRVIFLFLAR